MMMPYRLPLNLREKARKKKAAIKRDIQMEKELRAENLRRQKAGLSPKSMAEHVKEKGYHTD